MNVEQDRLDYERFQAEYGFRQEDIRSVVENERDRVPMPPGFQNVEVRGSAIHGLGCFTKADLKAGEVIAPARVGGGRTQAGRFTNHSWRPNCEYRLLEGGDAVLCAVEPIAKGSELTVDYRNVGTILGIKPNPAEVLVTQKLRSAFK